MKRLPTIIVAVVAVLVLIVGGWWAWQSNWLAFAGLGRESIGGEGGGNLSTGDEGNSVHALGTIQPAGGIIVISALPGDRIARLDAEIGRQYEQGHVFAVMDSYALREKEVQALENQLDDAVAKLNGERSAAESAVKTAAAAVEQAEAAQAEAAAQQDQLDVLDANTQLEESKLASLRDIKMKFDNDISDREIQQQGLLVSKLKAEKKAAQSGLDAAIKTAAAAKKMADANLAAAKSAQEQLAKADPAKSAAPAIDAKRLQLEQSIVKAPADGRVLKIHTRAGERIATQPILQMADLGKMICIAEVYENEARWVCAGDDAIIESDAFATGDEAEEMGGRLRLSGKVISKGRLIGDPTLQSLNPFATVDNHVLEVRIAIDKKHVVEAAKLINLQVDVKITVDKSRAPSDCPFQSEKSEP